MYLYLLLNLFTAFFPLLLSFDGRVKFSRQWRNFFPAALLVSFFFLVWDYYFTLWGVWGFNDAFLTGLYIGVLPIEEVMFFVTVPFACVFLYEVMRYYLTKSYLDAAAPFISAGLGIVLSIVALLNTDLLYTSTTFFLASALVLYQQFVGKAKFMGWFYLSFAVSLAPFLLINGVLTGAPVVVYNNAENLGIRLFTIPLEDLVYSLLLLLLNVSVFEFFKKLDRQQ